MGDRVSLELELLEDLGIILQGLLATLDILHPLNQLLLLLRQLLDIIWCWQRLGWYLALGGHFVAKLLGQVSTAIALENLCLGLVDGALACGLQTYPLFVWYCIHVDCSLSPPC